jgi:hypothetical protein
MQKLVWATYPHFKTPEEACKAGIDDMAAHGNKKQLVKVKDGSSSTTLSCAINESEQGNAITKVLECPATTSARSTDNSGEFSKMRCRCDDAKKGCPK